MPELISLLVEREATQQNGTNGDGGERGNESTVVREAICDCEYV